MRSPSFRLLALVSLVLPVAASAQGTLSTQGFGYPTGQMSTRSLGAGGSLGEIDPISATNPAAIIGFGSSALYFQAEPEYRKITNGAASEHSTIARFPLVTAAVPLSGNLFAGLSAASMLDRSFRTIARGTQVVGTDIVNSTNTFSSDGSISDLRLALAWAPRTWLYLGLAAHAISGDNRLVSTQQFDDSTRFAGIRDTTTVTYVGNAFSAGAEVFTGRYGVLAASYRRGGPLSLKRGDATLASAGVPDRLALSAAYLGIRGSSIAIRTAKETWSDMSGLGSADLPISEAWDTSVGADVLGPRFAGQTMQLRAGVRWRTLPFDARPILATGTFGPSGKVDEHSYSLGAGTTLARGRAAFDVAGIRSTRRSSATDVEESAWTLSIGITVRP